MKKSSYVLIGLLILFLPRFSSAQQADFAWRLGFSGGFSTYYGDLSPVRFSGPFEREAMRHLLTYNPHYADRPSFRISLERALSPGLGVQLHYGQYRFGMNDRFVRPDGSLQLDAPNFDRALNFRSDTYDLGFNFVFRSDNGRLLSERAFIAPYFTLGGGLMLYDLRADMRDDAGNPYVFSDPSLVQNRVFETRLLDFQTEERPNDGYAFYLNAGLGVRFRLNARFELFAQTDIMHAFSDQLDGVGGNFRESYASDFEAFLASPGTGGAGIEPGARRGDPSSGQDWVLFHGIGLKYSFGAQRNDFKAAKLSTPRPSYLEARGDIERAREEAEKAQARREREKAAADSLERLQLLERVASSRGQQERVVNHFYIETPDYAQLDRMDEQMQRLLWQQEIDRRERQKLANKQAASQNSALLSTFAAQRELLRRDTLLVAEERDSSLKATEDRVLELRYAQYRLEQEELRLDAEIDSLRTLAVGPVTPLASGASRTRLEATAVDRRALAKEMEAYMLREGFEWDPETTRSLEEALLMPISSSDTVGNRSVQLQEERSARSRREAVEQSSQEEAVKDSAGQERLAADGQTRRQFSSSDMRADSVQQQALQRRIDTLYIRNEAQEPTRVERVERERYVEDERMQRRMDQLDRESRALREEREALATQRQQQQQAMGTLNRAGAVRSTAGAGVGEGAGYNGSAAATASPSPWWPFAGGLATGVAVGSAASNGAGTQQSGVSTTVGARNVVASEPRTLEERLEAAAYEQEVLRRQQLALYTLSESVLRFPIMEDSERREFEQLTSVAVGEAEQVAAPRFTQGGQQPTSETQKALAAVEKRLAETEAELASLRAAREATANLDRTEVRLLNSKVEVFFGINQRQASEEEIQKLEDIARFVKERPGYRLQLMGFADNTGNISYNLRLIEDRIAFIREQLIEKFDVPADRVEKEVGGLVVRGRQSGTNDADRKVEVRIAALEEKR